MIDLIVQIFQDSPYVLCEQRQNRGRNIYKFVFNNQSEQSEGGP